MNIKDIAVIGAGTMGNGIAHTFAQYGYNVFLCDQNEELLKKALENISKNLDRQVKKQTITQDLKNETLGRLSPIAGINNIPDKCNIVIEAIFEDKTVKYNLFKELRNRFDKDTIFATNTSSISITELATASYPEKFIGMHFMNPVPMMKLVEIIRGHSTSEDTFHVIKELCISLDKHPVEVYDYPGFISNRILMPMINEAIFALHEGVASADDIDNVMKLGMNHPMGPLALADFIGLDVCLNIIEILYNGFNDPKYRPCPLLKKMVAAGKLGRKTGAGFYNYTS